MNYYRPRRNFRGSWLLAIAATLITAPAIAQTANFGTLRLSPDFEPAQGKTSGHTGGSYSLSAISNRDRHRKPCIGFADPKPDHIMILEKDFSRLKLLINSGGTDTTLLIQGPDDTTIRCGDDTGRNKDASVEDIDWKRGTYRIWIGKFNPGGKTNYTLTVQQ